MNCSCGRRIENCRGSMEDYPSAHEYYCRFCGMDIPPPYPVEFELHITTTAELERIRNECAGHIS